MMMVWEIPLMPPETSLVTAPRLSAISLFGTKKHLYPIAKIKAEKVRMRTFHPLNTVLFRIG